MKGVFAGFVTAAAATQPNKIYEAKEYMTKVKEVPNGILYKVDAEGTTMNVMHTYGNAYERGHAHGLLLADEIVDFIGPEIDTYFAQDIKDAVPDNWPEFVRDLAGHAG